ncbi:ribosome recycling factor domain-containing protein [Phialemonium atrogriseum]|uniref:Ribosome recycling factor domain-containing protein n=1 Tax=Phialemonium atrogriseum TaxID=1093897 RepID=A0AAJ0BXD8_9PEZI|nr:ribosome recycling factor domain-containing protein [Phialemonium atrogriseum]KAK1764827.1 ribosome recycling factor domain-containing protein [Phialemonium atrogriseum]
MRAGGRFNPDAIGAVRVRPDKKSAETFPLHELAAVVPKGGRNIGVLVHEAAYIKPVMSAIQASPDFNQQPQRSEENELELILKVEPERKEGLVKRAKELCHAWREQVRAERHKRDVVVKRWHKDGLLTANDKTRLEKELQKLQDKRMAHVDSKEKEILQHIAAKEGR